MGELTENLILIVVVIILILLITKRQPNESFWFPRQRFIGADPATLAEAGESEMNDI